MNGFQAAKVVAEREGRSLYSISAEMGRNTNYLSAAASKGTSPSCTTMAEVLGKCGWTLAAVPDADLPESAIVID